MITFALNLMSFLFKIIGDQLMIKWVSAFRIWYYQITDPVLKMMIEDQYQQMLSDWSGFQIDRDDQANLPK